MGLPNVWLPYIKKLEILYKWWSVLSQYTISYIQTLMIALIIEFTIDHWIKKKQNLWRFFLILFFKFYGKKNSRLFIFWSSTNNHYIAAIFNCQKIHSSNIKKSNFWPLFIFVKRNEWPSMRTAATNYKNLTGSWYSTISKNTLLISISRCCIPLLILDIKKFNFVMFKITNKKRKVFVFCHFDSIMNIFWRYVLMKCSIVAEII